ncbi:MAG: hypothetical protein KF746_01460 [Chitinophagaceae bacterium]|nr:hypothetical protein [Chitinophagaceae bacterium]
MNYSSITDQLFEIIENHIVGPYYNDPLKADTADVWMRQTFEQHLPGILPEAALWMKDDAQPQDTNLLWIVNPYRKDLMGKEMTSVALAHSGTLRIGIIANFSDGEMIIAVEGEGTQLAGTETVCKVRETVLPKGNSGIRFAFPDILAQRVKSHPHAKLILYFQEKYNLTGVLNSVPTNMTYYMTQVARGNMHFVWSTGHFSYHDIAAAICVVQQAGGIVTDFEGGDRGLYEGSSFFCSNKKLHGQFMETVTEVITGNATSDIENVPETQPVAIDKIELLPMKGILINEQTGLSFGATHEEVDRILGSPAIKNNKGWEHSANVWEYPQHEMTLEFDENDLLMLFIFHTTGAERNIELVLHGKNLFITPDTALLPLLTHKNNNNITDENGGFSYIFPETGVALQRFMTTAMAEDMITDAKAQGSYEESKDYLESNLKKAPFFTKICMGTKDAVLLEEE